MPELDLLDANNKKIGTVDVDPAIFDADKFILKGTSKN